LPLQAIIYAWTVGSYLLGTAGEQELVRRVEQRSNGIPVLMSAPAATAGFRALEAERIALIHAPFFRAIGVIAALEEDLRRPVLTANQVSLWWALRAAGTEVRVDDYGQLFTLPRG
jgi:maleate cis-trans isomerase